MEGKFLKVSGIRMHWDSIWNSLARWRGEAVLGTDSAAGYTRERHP